LSTSGAGEPQSRTGRQDYRKRGGRQDQNGQGEPIRAGRAAPRDVREADHAEGPPGGASEASRAPRRPTGWAFRVLGTTSEGYWVGLRGETAPPARARCGSVSRNEAGASTRRASSTRRRRRPDTGGAPDVP